MKKNIFIFFVITSLFNQLNALMVHIDNVRYSVVQAADRYLAQKGFPVSDVPSRLMTEYYQKIDAVIDSLRGIASSGGRSYIDDQEISSEIRYQFGMFYENLRTVVVEKNIDFRVTDSIQEAFRTHGIFVSELPSSMLREFQSRREAILRRLRSAMMIDGRDYVRVNEIEKFVKEEMLALINRAKQQLYGSTQSEGSGFWNMLSDWLGVESSTSTQSRPSSSMKNDGKVFKENLDSKVLDVVNRHFSRNGINSDQIPLRVVPEYTGAISKILSNLRDRMTNHGRDYVTIAEIELMVSQRLKDIVDSIKLVGKECSICRDEYYSGEIVANLSCGHIFHKSCVDTWFKHKKVCPECFLTTSGIESKETIP